MINRFDVVMLEVKMHKMRELKHTLRNGLEPVVRENKILKEYKARSCLG